MRKIYFYALTASLLFGCTKSEEIIPEQQIATARTFVASIEGNETRVHAEGLSVVWDDRDEISVIGDNNYRYIYSANEKEFSPAENEGITDDVSVYAVYPYAECNTIVDGKISLTFPAEQSYAEDSFGPGANVMIAKSSDDELPFKNVGAYLKLQLYGEGVTVKSISFQGNNNERLAGAALLSFDENGTPKYEWNTTGEDGKVLTLNCPEEGVTLNANKDDATTFWFVVPPQKIEGGFTIAVKDSFGRTFIRSTAKPVELERNWIIRMAAIELSYALQPADEVWCYDAEGNVAPVNIGDSGAISVENFLPIAIDFETLTPSGENLVARAAIKSVSIPEGVTSIDMAAFAFCTSLESVVLPESLKTIGFGAFGACTSLNNIEIPEGVTTIGEGAFLMSGLESVKIPSGVEKIGDAAFAQCTNLESVEIPDGVTTIGGSAFAETGLESVNIPSSVTTIGMQAFAQTGLKTVVIEEGTEPLVFEAQAFAGCTQLESVSIPSNVATITDSAFWGCSSLSSVTLAEGIQTIGAGAFCDCGSLKNITLPKTLKAIETQAFKNTALEGELTIPNSVERIDMQAFLDDNGNNRLTKVKLSNQITIIQQQTFAGCTYLEEIDFNEAPISQIGGSAFSGCNLGCFELETTAESLTLQAGALHSCGAYGIILPANVVSIGHDAFGVQLNVEAEKDLRWIYCKAENPPALVKSGVVEFCFASNSSLSKIYIPSVYIGNYNVNIYWNAACYAKRGSGGEYNIDENLNIEYVGSGNGEYVKKITFEEVSDDFIPPTIND